MNAILIGRWQCYKVAPPFGRVCFVDSPLIKIVDSNSVQFATKQKGIWVVYPEPLNIEMDGDKKALIRKRDNTVLYTITSITDTQLEIADSGGKEHTYFYLTRLSFNK